MKNNTALATAGALALLSATTSEAAVVYDFSGAGGGQSFSFTTDDFISSDATFASALLDSCNCSSIVFDVDWHVNDPADNLRFIVGSTTYYYYFMDGSFGTLGTHNTIDVNQGTLTVSGAPVPEPSTWAMMLIGFGATGYAMRRRRPQNSGNAQLA